MNYSVSAFLARHNFVNHSDVNLIANAILDDMNKGLSGQKSDQDMILTYSLPPKSKVKNKSVIVIDAGGTNFRSCLVTFDENGNAIISDLEKTKMPATDKELSKKEFFNQIAKNLEHLKNKAESIGFCFSYPMTITQDGDGIVTGFSKEVKAPEVVGSKVGESLKQTLEEHGWNTIKTIRLLNDTVAALLAGAAISGKQKYSSFIGFILGTGMNAAYIQPQNPDFPGVNKQIVVCESGKNKNVIRSDFDIEFDKTTARPGEFYIEKCCSGAYLGPVSLIMLKTAAKEEIFSPYVCKKILELTSLSTVDIDSFLHEPYDTSSCLGRLMAESARDKDYDLLFQILDAMVERSARHAAAILSACVIQSQEGKIATKPVCILCNGTTFHKTYMLKERVCAYLDEVLTRERGLSWRIVSVDNDITLGTAISGVSEE